MTSEASPGDWYAQACERARAFRRRTLAAQASTQWPEFVPPVALSDGPLGAIQAADREIARQTARRARAVAAFAAARPADVDRAQGEPGAMSPERWAARPEILRPVSEWAARELVVALSISEQAATDLLTRSLTLVHRLPGTLAALEAGALHPGHLWPLLEKVAPIGDDQVRAEVEAALLRWAAGTVVTPAQLGAKARREVARRDARAAVRQLEKALTEQRGIRVRPHAVDGLGVLTVTGTMPEVLAVQRALGAYADTLHDTVDPATGEADPRTRGQKMVDCLLDLVLRASESELPPVQLLLTLVAAIDTVAGSDTPGELDGHTIPAEMVRQLLIGLTGNRRPGNAAGNDGLAAAQALPDPESWPDEDQIMRAAPGRDELERIWAREQEELEAWWDEMERRVLAGELIDPDPLSEGEPVADDADDADDAGGDAAPTRPFADLDDDRAPGQPGSGDDLLAYEIADHDLLAYEIADDELFLRVEARGDRVTGDQPGGDDRTGDGSAFDIYTAHRQRVLLDDPAAAHRSAAADRSTAVDPRAEAPPPGEAVEASHGDPPPDADQQDPPGVTVSGGGWWVAADRAVDEASRALLHSQLDLGHARQLVQTAVAADALDEASWQAGPNGRLADAADSIEALRRMGADQQTLLRDLFGATGGGGLADRPRLAITDTLTGALLALTDLPGLTRAGTCGRPQCRTHPENCTHDLTGRPALGPPGPTDGYRPGAELDRYMRARDRRCRFPGCRRRVPRGGELDHHVPYPLGATSPENLAGYCTGDHRGKHQAPGWDYQLDPDGTLTVTTPTGLVATTTPPPF